MRLLLTGLILSITSVAIAADLTITAANVQRISGRITNVAVATSKTAGMFAELNGGSWGIVPTGTDDSDIDSDPSEDLGVMLTSTTSSESEAVVQLDGRITIGATTVKGELYLASFNTAGKLAPWTDFPPAAKNVNILNICGVAEDTSGNMTLINKQLDVSSTSSSGVGVWD